MSAETFWLGRLASGAVAAWLLVSFSALVGRRGSHGRVALRRHLDSLSVRLRLLRSSARAELIVSAQAVLGVAAVVAALTLARPLVLLLLPVLVLGPNVFIDRRVAKRTADIEAQLENWLSAVANALKATPSLGEAIASTSRLVPAPMSQEVDLLVREYELGTPLDEALQRFSDRIPSQSVAGAVLALKVARRAGGNLTTMLESASAALRELTRLEGVVRSKTAEGKAQAFVISAIPIPMVLAISSIDPDFFTPLADTFAGNLVVGTAGLFWVLAIALAWKILAVDV